MQKRTTERLVPEWSTVIVVDLGEDHGGDHHFKIPSPLMATKILRSVEVEHLSALAGLAGIGDDGILAAMVRLRSSGVELMQVVGALIGHSWRHKWYDLDSDPKAFDDVLAFGEAVYEELDENGYDFALLSLLSVRLTAAIVERNTVQSEAMDRLGFTSQKTEEPTSSSSTSESTTSGTPGASLA